MFNGCRRYALAAFLIYLSMANIKNRLLNTNFILLQELAQLMTAINIIEQRFNVNHDDIVLMAYLVELDRRITWKDAAIVLINKPKTMTQFEYSIAKLVKRRWIEIIKPGPLEARQNKMYRLTAVGVNIVREMNMALSGIKLK